MNKDTFKGLIMGLVLFLTLSTGVLVLANTQSREVVYGVRVNINNQLISFEQDSQPFVSEGRTFLPVRAIADALGVSVSFNEATNTVYLTSDEQAATAPATSQSSIVGSWIWNNHTLWYTFEANGHGATGSNQNPMTWSTENGILTIRGQGSPQTFYYIISNNGNTLTLTRTGTESTYIYTRQN